MGAYDYRCLWSGISLRGAECVAIVPQREAQIGSSHRIAPRVPASPVPPGATTCSMGWVSASRTAPGPEPRLEVDPIDVPALRASLAVGRGTFSDVLFIVPKPPPVWLTDDEKYEALIPFTFGGANVSGS
ncbi:hypothetical protein EJ065_4368 [Corallococcus coralloides]|uniref:Uncharacterized protein n=1 Tax=Corallococcus coralloides TaxID=184914 RepID=A0A410RVR2_CORCK|nr:hypothetical protein [Corallococcus coralloides]QAT85921.1 hypothetical protein EJ065_4368 [Corallococcus coralloides]